MDFRVRLSCIYVSGVRKSYEKIISIKGMFPTLSANMRQRGELVLVHEVSCKVGCDEKVVAFYVELHF